MQKPNIKTDNNYKREIYSEKTNNSLYIAFGILIFDILTYIIALAFNLYDFGIYFEIFSIITTLFAINYNKKDLSKKAKFCIILAIFAISFLIIYDLVCLIPYLFEYSLVISGIFFPSITDILGITLILINYFLIKAYISLCKYENIRKSTDWFYEKK